ncbi:MAG: ParB/RepB/Spo0J family partition protein, partial [Bacteroidales bacterium]|nr:ParB/RepB/Spo0J family partition protein [Bacteroidales bacterium]
METKTTILKELQEIEVKNIAFDEQNPRGETEDHIISDRMFDTLKDSIREHGVLEPVIIKNNNKKQDKIFVLIDGERRLRAVKDLKFQTIPALIAKSELDGRAIAYQIHMHRKPWPRAAEARAIKQIILDLKHEDPNISETEIKKRLKAITNHKPSAIAEFLDIMKYDDSVIGKVMSGAILQSYLTRIEKDFTVLLEKYHPALVDTFGLEKIRAIMLYKAEHNLLENTRYMMDSNFRKIIKNQEYKDEVEIII